MAAAVPAGFLLLFFLYPLIITLLAAADADAWTTGLGRYEVERIGTALVQATLSMALTMALAFPLAWHHHRVAMPWSRTHLAIHAAPFVLPVFVVVGAARELLGPAGWISRAFGTDLSALLGPMGLIVLAHAYYNYGFAARIIYATLERRPWRLEESARTLGASPVQVMARVTLPALAPGLASAGLLVWMFCFTSFGVVLFLGNGQLATLETLIYSNLRGVDPHPERAAVLGVLQLALNVLLLWGYFRLHRRITGLPRDPDPKPTKAGSGHRLLAGLALLAGILPAASVLVGGFRLQGNWSFEPWRAILDVAHPAHLTGFELGPVVLRTFGYAAGTAVLATVLAVLLGATLRRMGRLRAVAEPFAALPLGTSSVLLGLGYILAFGAGSWLDLRGRWIAILIVHTLIAFPLVARAVLPAMDQHDRRMDDAAATLGATPLAVAMRIQWPMLRGPILAAAGLAAAISIGDFGASLLLMQRDTMGLTVWIGEHDRPFDSMLHAQSVALTGLVGVLAVAAYLVAERFHAPEAR